MASRGDGRGKRTGARPQAAAGSEDATSPAGIPAGRWRHVLRRVVAHVFSDRLMAQSAAVAFFAVLSIAPVLVTAISVYGAVNTPQQALQQMSGVVRMLPTELEPLVADQLTTITTASTQVLTFRGLTGLLAALSTAATASSYLIDGLTLAYHETETRSFRHRMGIALAIVFGGALLLGAVIAAAGAVSRWLQGAPALVRGVAPVLTWGAIALVMTGALAVLYRFAPDRKDARWRWITGGSAVATVLWLATTIGLFTYVETLGSYESTYGPLAGVAISMFWLWATILLVILGAAVNAETERETARDSTVGPDRPLGERGAVVADSAPPYPGEE